MSCAADYNCCKRQTRPRQREHPTSTKWKLSHSNKNLVSTPRWGLTPRLTGQLTFGPNVTLT
jgi:hypothetical protein